MAATRFLVSESLAKEPLFERRGGRLLPRPRRARRFGRTFRGRRRRQRLTPTKICCSPTQSGVYVAWAPCPPGWRVVRGEGKCPPPKEFNQGTTPADTLKTARRVPGLFDPEWARPRGYIPPPFIPRWLRPPRIGPVDLNRYCANLTEEAEAARAARPWLCPRKIAGQFPIYTCRPDLKVTCILEGRPVPPGFVTSIGQLPPDCKLRRGSWELPPELLKAKPPPDLRGLRRTPREVAGLPPPPAPLPGTPSAPAPAPEVTGYTLCRRVGWPGGIIAIPVGTSCPAGFVPYP